MAEPANGPWWVVAAASAPSLASGAWVLWRWWFERGDKLHGDAAGREQSLMRDLESQRAALSRDHAELFDRLRNELERTQKRLLAVERDRDRGWDLARWWNQRAHELRHVGLNAQQIVLGFCAREGVDAPAWPAMDIPGLEEPR